MPNPADPGTFDIWITDRIAFATAPPKSDDTGDFDTWITDRIAWEDFVAAAAGASYFRTVSDPIGATDTISTARDLAKSLTDAVGIADTFSRVGTYVKNITDSVSIADTISTARDLVISLADSIGITDAIAAVVKITVNLTDSVGITDAFSRVGTFIKSISDPVGIADSLSTALDKVIVLADAVGITDTVATVVGKIVSLSDAVGITDALATARDIAISIADAIGITDLLSNIGTFFLRPDGDHSIGQWTDELDGTTNIYQSIDEPAPPVDSDYIQSPFAPQTQSYTCTLSDISDPGVDTGHTLSYRYRKFPTTNQQVDLTVTFLQGAVELTSWDHVNVASGWITANQLISSGIIASITDYTDLRLRFEADIV